MHGEKTIKSKCEFIGRKNNKLNYRCKESKGEYLPSQ